MSEEFGPDFLTVTDEDGNELVLEYVDTLKISAHLLDEIVGIHKAMPYDVLVFCHGIIIFHVSIKMKLGRLGRK